MGYDLVKKGIVTFTHLKIYYLALLLNITHHEA